MVSWNVRGLGGQEKRKEVHSLVKEKRLWILCLQETKLQMCDDGGCLSVWDSQPVAFYFRSSLGAFRGLLT